MIFKVNEIEKSRKRVLTFQKDIGSSLIKTCENNKEEK
jgi:hypothetical protein